MPEVPKIVYSRLRAGGSSAGHPDADLLTAFAEQALSPEEREGVLQHLAVCGDCREVVAIALPASESVRVPQVASEEATVTTIRQARARRNWFGWLGLRGVAVAAGVVVASVLILRSGKPPQSRVENTVASVSKQAEPPLEEAASAKPAAPPVERAFSDTAKSDELRTSKDEARQAQLKSQFSKELKIESTRKPAELAKMQAGAALGDMKRADRGEADKLAPVAAPPAMSGAISGGSVSQAAGVPASADQQAPPASAEAVTAKAVTETVEVTAASPLVQTADASTNQSLTVMGRNMEDIPVVKAKAPAPSQKAATAARTKKQALGASSNYAYDASAQPAAIWQLSEGTLQHSLNAGTNWQTVLRSDHPLLCHATRGTDIWAAGQAGTVFHSTDGGVTWTQLHPTAKDQPLTADVTGIDLQKPGEAMFTTITGERWTTMDNGKTWSMTGTIKK